MDNDTHGDGKVYTTKEIATLLDMAISTVRKYAQHLEKSGYIFNKTASKARIFSENDIMVFRYLKDLRDKTNITVEQATSIVIERFGKDEAASTAALDNPPTDIPYETQYNEMEMKLNKQAEQIKALSARLDKAEKQSDRRYKLLLDNMKKLLHPLKALLQENKKRTSWISRIFGK
jgi:DNA-binding transcriptional MerR regulator